MVSSSISAYLTTAGENIDYYYNSGNVKQVAMNTEVAATSVTDLVSTNGEAEDSKVIFKLGSRNKTHNLKKKNDQKTNISKQYFLIINTKVLSSNTAR